MGGEEVVLEYWYSHHLVLYALIVSAFTLGPDVLYLMYPATPLVLALIEFLF